MASAETVPDNIIDLDRHPRAWANADRVKRHLEGKRESKACVDAAARFAGATAPLGDTLPRTWTAPLIESLPAKPTLQDLEVAVAGAARYFEYLKAQGAIDRLGIQMCEYDLLTAAHIAEEMIYAGLDRAAMAFEVQHDAAERVREIDKELAARRNVAIAGEVSWLGAWVQVERRWVVVWAAAGGGPRIASVEVNAGDRAAALGAVFLNAFAVAADKGCAPARRVVFSQAQERALRDLDRDLDVDPLPIYRLRCTSTLRFWAEELLWG